MTAMHQPFKASALAYQAIYDYVRDNTTVENPIKVATLYDALKQDVRDFQQVRDAVKRFRDTKAFASIREGQQIVIWWRGDDTPKQAAVKSVKLPKPVPQAQPVTDMPEVKITKAAIHIMAGGVKITIER